VQDALAKGWNRACQVLFSVPVAIARNRFLILPSESLSVSFDDVFSPMTMIAETPAVVAWPVEEFPQERFQRVLEARQRAVFEALRGIVFYPDAGAEAGLRDEGTAKGFSDDWRAASETRLAALRARVVELTSNNDGVQPAAEQLPIAVSGGVAIAIGAPITTRWLNPRFSLAMHVLLFLLLMLLWRLFR
jgi:hypothetical protein